MSVTDDQPITDEDVDPAAEVLPTDACAGCGDNAPIGAPCPNCQSTDRVHDRALGVWNPNAPGSLARVLATVDVFTLEFATRGLEDLLGEQIGIAANARRRARVEEIAGPGAPIDAVTFGESDIAPLVRDLYDASSVLERIGKAFIGAAKFAKAEVGEEAAMIGVGAGPQAIRRSVRIPHGGMGKIVVTEKVDSVDVWEDNTIADVIGQVVASEESARAAGPDGPNVRVDNDDPDDGWSMEKRMTDYLDGVRFGAKEGIMRAITLRGKSSWLIGQIKGLREGLQRSGRDDMAGSLERAHVTDKTPTGEYEVKWESK